MSEQGMLLDRLVLVGYRKNYEIPFNPGVNIIHGDADTGKSSIFKFVYYLLGGKKIHVDTEIAASVRYPLLQLSIGERKYTIRRDLLNPSKDIEVFKCAVEDMGTLYPEKYAASLTANSSKMSLSEFLMAEQNFPIVKIKQAPTKDDSKLVRLSILDIFKYMYLDQDEVGSKRMLDIGNPSIEVKNREVFKYIFDVLDSNITDLNDEISRKTKEKNNLLQEFGVIKQFLASTDFDSVEELDEKIGEIEQLDSELKSRLENLNLRLTSDSDFYKELRAALTLINDKVFEYESIKKETSESLDRFSRLKNDYVNDISKLMDSRAAKTFIGEDSRELSTCPICDSGFSVSEIEEKFDISESDKVNQEVNSLRRRLKDIEELLKTYRSKMSGVANELDGLYGERELARKMIDDEMQASISPYLSERDSIVSELSVLQERRDKYAYILKVRNQHNKIFSQIEKLNLDIEALKERLEKLEDEAPSIDDILKNLGSGLDNYLQHISIKNRTGVSLSERSFLPVLRGNEYRNINSGGMRTILSIGYLAVLLEAKLKLNTNLPSFIMIDTVGKYLGKTTRFDDTDQKEDEAEGVSDPNKYKNIYSYLIGLAEKFEDESKVCQILLVDNDLPQQISEEYEGFVLKQFSSNGLNGFPVGLIDDWDDYSADSEFVPDTDEGDGMLQN